MGLLDVMCPSRCSGCGSAGPLLCHRCQCLLDAPARRHVPTPCPRGMPAAWVVATYDGPVRTMLLDFKERGAVGLARPLGAAVARAVVAANRPRTPLLLVPVPSAVAAVRRRGDDVVGMLATQAARRLRAQGWPARTGVVLAQRRGMADSAGLSAAQRAVNLAGALAVRPSRAHLLRGAAVVVIDDLITTGATLSEASGALSAAGADVLGAAAVAATQLRNARIRPMGP